MIKESDIVYENDKYWILKTDKDYEVLENTITHSIVKGYFGSIFLDRAIDYINNNLMLRA